MRLHIKYFLIFVILLVSTIFSPLLFGQKKIPAGFCISPVERAFADSINRIRVKQGKRPLQLSISLSFVAKTHVRDLILNHPDTSFCNLLSWSNKGSWTACCYNSYVVGHEGMWEKPKELTSYPYRAYEMAAFTQDRLVPDSILQLWETSREALNMILTEGAYVKKSWLCMGVGLNGHYASVWFGQRKDLAGEPTVCRNTKKRPVSKKQAKKNIKKSRSYYLIIGNYMTMKDATEALRRFRKNGFTKAGILKSGKKIRIYLHRYNGFKAAVKGKQKLPFSYREAWILAY